jgi:hypothetical protein
VNTDLLYALGDGDGVRVAIEKELLAGDLDEAGDVSRRLTCAMQILLDSVRQHPGWQVAYSGGDDLCLIIDRGSYDESIIRDLILQFKNLTGVTISFGIGASVEDAYLNLRRAKALGGNTLMAPSQIAKVHHQ